MTDRLLCPAAASKKQKRGIEPVITEAAKTTLKLKTIQNSIKTQLDLRIILPKFHVCIVLFGIL